MGPGVGRFAPASWLRMLVETCCLAREMLHFATLLDGRAVKVPGIAPESSVFPGRSDWLGQRLDARADQVLRKLAYAPEAIAVSAWFEGGRGEV